VSTTIQCSCGKRHRLSNTAIKAFLEAVVRRNGDMIEVVTQGKRYRVSRYYIAFHGLRSKDCARLAKQGLIEEVK
jgi:hypothetical protein